MSCRVHRARSAAEQSKRSGVLALVFFGLEFANRLKTACTQHVQHALHSNWEVIGWTANVVVFVYSGVMVSGNSSSSAYYYNISF